MKKLTSAKSKLFEPGEAVRVVPLHHPKPVVAIDELARAGAEGRDEDLFDGKPHPAPASAHLSYQGGPLIANVEVFTIFWGTQWGTGGTPQQMMGKINDFFRAIVTSPLIDQLAEYNVPGQAIGHGSFIGTKTVSANAPVGSITDSSVRAQVKKWVRANAVPKPTNNTLYFIYLDPGIISVMGGGKSCQSYCGYHNNTGKIYYAVMPYPTCSGCLGGMPALEALTATSSHELCEAITDPVPGSGWYDSTNGEIGDICAWNFKQVGGFTVQLEWSNRQNKGV